MTYIFFRPLAIRKNYLKEKNLLEIIFLFQREFTEVKKYLQRSGFVCKNVIFDVRIKCSQAWEHDGIRTD